MEATSRTAKARVLIVDDHPVFRYGVMRILDGEPDLEVCGELEDGAGIMETLRTLRPDVILMDIALRGVDGLALTQRIHARYPSIPVLVVSMHDARIYAPRAFRCGAAGYIMKEETSHRLVEAVRTVLMGKRYLDESLGLTLAGKAGRGVKPMDTRPVDKLSPRERQIFTLIGQGQTARAIAAQLVMGGKTVETHRERIKSKLGLRTGTALNLAAIQWVADQKQVPQIV